MLKIRTCTWALLMLPLAVWSADTSGLSFQHQDWELACDNTRTCRAAGYQREEGEDVQPMSVLLTRKAGPREPVVAELMLGSLDGDDQLAALPQPLRLAMSINGRSLGKVAFDKRSVQASLSVEQTSALLAALPRTSRIEWRAGNAVWRLSDKGASAVLLKMDEVQGRLGTPGALVRKGGGDESRVLPPLPMPVVHLRLPEGKTKQGVPPALFDALRASVAKSDECSSLEEGEATAAEVQLTQLHADLWLATAKCWMAAYNMGFGYWVVRGSPPYSPVLVTTMGSDHDQGRIYASHKGRGIGDCWSTDEWVWDGQQFVHTRSATTGMCRLVAAGGAWSLPTLVTEVKR